MWLNKYLSRQYQQLTEQAFLGKGSTKNSFSNLSVYNMFTYPDKMKQGYSNSKLMDHMQDFKNQIKEIQMYHNELKNKYN